MNTGEEPTSLTTHEAPGRRLEEAHALQALWVGAGGVDTSLQTACDQPVRQPVELAVAQETVALNDAVEKRGERGRHRKEKL